MAIHALYLIVNTFICRDSEAAAGAASTCPHSMV